MKPKNLRVYMLSVLILAMLAACQAVPAVTTAKTPTAVISSQNAAQLTAAQHAAGNGSLNDLVWALDGTALLSVNGSGAVRYSSADLEIQETFSFDHPAALYAASPDGKTLAFSEDSYNIYLANMEVTQNACTIYSPAMLGSIEFSPDGKALLGTSMEEILVTLWDAASGAQLQTISGFETAAPVYTAKFGENGKRIIWISRGSVQLSEMDSQELGPAMSHEDFVVSAALSPDGSLLASAAAGTVNGNFMPVIELWDTASGKISATLTYPEAFNALAFSPDGSLLAAASGSKLIFWDTVSYEQVAELAGGDEDIFDLAFSPDGTALAASGSNGTITLWKVK